MMGPVSVVLLVLLAAICGDCGLVQPSAAGHLQDGLSASAKAWRAESIAEHLLEKALDFLESRYLLLPAGPDHRKLKPLKGLKLKRGLPYILLTILTIFGLSMPLFLKVLGLVAAKAFLISKLALVTVALLSLKKAFGGGDEGYKGPSTVHVHAGRFTDRIFEPAHHHGVVNEFRPSEMLQESDYYYQGQPGTSNDSYPYRFYNYGS